MDFKINCDMECGSGYYVRKLSNHACNFDITRNIKCSDGAVVPIRFWKNTKESTTSFVKMGRGKAYKLNTFFANGFVFAHYSHYANKEDVAESLERYGKTKNARAHCLSQVNTITIYHEDNYNKDIKVPVKISKINSCSCTIEILGKEYRVKNKIFVTDRHDLGNYSHEGFKTLAKNIGNEQIYDIVMLNEKF